MNRIIFLFILLIHSQDIFCQPGLSEGAKLLFNGVTTKLTNEEKDQIFQSLKFNLSKDKKQFVNESDKNGEYPFEAEVTTVDLNRDGKEEIVVTWGITVTAGRSGSTATLFIRTGNVYQENLGTGGDIEGVIPSFTKGFPDLSIADPYTGISVWRYNGNQYKFYGNYGEAQYKNLKPVTFEDFKINSRLAQGSKVQTTALSEGANLLFKDVKTKLTADEKNRIYEMLKFRLSTDKKEFVVTEYDETGTNSFLAFASPVDLNGDNTEEVFVAWGNSYTSGMAGISVTLFIKDGDTYTENLGFSGDVSDLIPSLHNGFPDLSISGPGVKIPIWRYNGSQYEFYKAVSEAEYKKLKPVSFAAFKKNPKLILGSKNPVDATTKRPGTSTAIKQMGPNPYAKTLIIRRWLTMYKILSGSNQREEIPAGDSREMEFDAKGKVFVYIDGNLHAAANYIMAPDGRSLLITKEGEREQTPIKIISIKPTELMIKWPELFGDDTMIFKASR